MPIKPETVAEFFGIDPAGFDDDDAFRAHAGKQWTKVDEATRSPEVRSKVLGSFNGILRSRAKKAFTTLGVNAEGVDFDATDPPELIDALIERTTKTMEERTKELEEKLKKKGGEEAAAEWQRKLTEAEKKVKDYEAANQQIRTEFDTFRSEIKQREEQSALQTYWQQAEKEVKFRQGLSELELEGFRAKTREMYKLQRDEEGKIYTTDAKGERIPDGSKHLAFKPLGVLLNEAAAAMNIHEKTPHGGKQVAPIFAPRKEAEGDRPKPLRRVADAAVVGQR